MKQTSIATGEHPVSPPLCHGFSIEAAISQHLDLHSSHWRPGTYSHHVHRLIPFLRYLTQQHIAELSDITPSLWSQYVQHRRESVSDATLHHDGQVIRLFLKECVRREWLAKSPLEGVKITPMPHTPIATPNTSELNRLLKAVRQLHNPRLHKNTKYETPKERAFFTARNLAFYVGLVATGCRVGELIDLPIDQVNMKDLTFTFLKTKTHTGRVVPFDDAENLLYLPLLQKYLGLRPKVDTDKVFINEWGEPWVYEAVRSTWRRARYHAKLEDFSLHSLRHYSLTKLYIESGDLRAAMAAAGHTNVSTAMRYQKRDLSHVRAAMKKANLIAGVDTGHKKKVI